MYSVKEVFLNRNTSFISLSVTKADNNKNIM